MKLFYYTQTGRIIKVVRDTDVYFYDDRPNTGPLIAQIDIQESNVPLNNRTRKYLLQDVLKHIEQDKRDVNGDHKYYIDRGQIIEREGWEEEPPEPPIARGRPDNPGPPPGIPPRR